MYSFLFKQKTADVMRISDWISDVCSSDLHTGSPYREICARSQPGRKGADISTGRASRSSSLSARSWTTVMPVPLAADRPWEGRSRLAHGPLSRRLRRRQAESAERCDHGHDQTWRSNQPHSGRSAESRSEEHTSELQSLMRISYAVFCL